MSKFLELLKEAGVDTATLEKEALGDLQKSFDGAVGEAVEIGTTKLQGEFGQLEKRLSGQDSKITDYDKKVKELEAELVAAKAVKPATVPQAGLDAMVRQEVAPLRELIEEMAEATKAQAAEIEAQKARILRRELIDKLSEKIPALQDPRFAKLMPETTDEAVLAEFGKTISDLAEQTEVDAYKQIRDGYVPPSAPPRVAPGNEGEFQSELARIRDLEASGELTPQKARAKIEAVAKLMKPKE